MSQVRVAVDVGYWGTKVLWANGEHGSSIFPSAVGTPDEARFSLGFEGKSIILREPRNVVIGRRALMTSRHVVQSRSPDWVRSPEWYDLFLASLTEVTQALNYNLDLCVGLPMAHYKPNKEIVRARLQDTHVVVREGRQPQRFHVHEVRVVPQAWGVVIDQAIDGNGEYDVSWLNYTVGVIDIGGNTTNILALDGLAEVPSGSTSIAKGAMDITSALQAWLNDNCPGLSLRTHKLMRAVTDRKVMYDGEWIDLSEVIEGIAEPMVAEVVAQTSQRWPNLVGIDKLLIGGGGGALLGAYIQERIPRAILVDDPVMANVRGYFKLLGVK